MFNEAETLKWVNAYREEFGLLLLDKLPAGQQGNGKACMMGTATPGLVYGASPEVILYDGYMVVPEFVQEAEMAFEHTQLPDRYYERTDIQAAMEESDRIARQMTPTIVGRLRAKLSRDAWGKAEA